MRTKTIAYILAPGLLVTIIILSPFLTDSSALAEEVFTNSIGMKFAPIPAGTFVMGSPEAETKASSRTSWLDFLGSVSKLDKTQHKVTISKPFYLQTTPVTQGHWKRVMKKNPSMHTKCGEDCPVESVSWEEAQEFLKRLNQMESISNYRLPTEAEWEYACRAGTITKYNWGDEDPVCEPGAKNGARFDDDSKCDDKGPAPVMTYAPNHWGLYDMHGNVGEWCQDWFGDFATAHVADPKGPTSGKGRVLRGGSYASYSWRIGAADRGWAPVDYRRHTIGFRVAKDF
jgi:formylglycine-generating enzyme required for sulfatase activity